MPSKQSLAKHDTSPSKPISVAENTPDYLLQGTDLDVPIADVLSWSASERRAFIVRFLAAADKEISAGTMALKRTAPFAREMREYRQILKLPADAYLRLDELTFKRNVLMAGAPGRSHTYWSRHQMWRMATKFGDVARDIQTKDSKLVRRLEKLLDGQNKGKAMFRAKTGSVLLTLARYLEGQYNLRTAFPPFHARFFADLYLPANEDSIVVDPCAGWGGRLIGTLLVNRRSRVEYIGVDPNENNQPAYAGLLRRIGYLRKEIKGERVGRVDCRPFEKWIHGKDARALIGRADLVITSPPYWTAEVYDPKSKEQSANRFPTYKEWREGFYRPLVDGAFAILKPGGVFVLNIADVVGAPLERDARKLTREAGFKGKGFYKLAMSRSPGTLEGKPRHSVQVDGIVWKHEPVFVFEKPISL